MQNIFIIRQEHPSDYTDVYKLVQLAFATASHSDGTEADYLSDVRKKSTFIPELSLVAEDLTGYIVGQIVLYQTAITTITVAIPTLVLSPISVHPDHFRRGIARAMIDKAFERAVKIGYTSVFLCGEPEIYKGLGFKTSYEYGIYHKDDPHAEWCMGRELVPGALTSISGTIDIV